MIRYGRSIRKDVEYMTIRYAKMSDKEFWFSLDKHISEKEFEYKVKTNRGYVILLDDKPVGILRFNMFWDNTPFCTMLYIKEHYRGRGYGGQLLSHWEDDMRSQGYGMLLTSTQADETAQHFYRKQGYRDCGGFVIDVPGYEQPLELFLIKAI